MNDREHTKVERETPTRTADPLPSGVQAVNRYLGAFRYPDAHPEHVPPAPEEEPPSGLSAAALAGKPPTTRVADRRTVRRRPASASRRAGYVIAAALNIVLLYLINVRPGWAAVPFLTDETATILALINLSLIVGVVVNVLQIGYDPPWFVALGALLTTGVGLVVLVRIWQVFPFAFSGAAEWTLIARTVLVVAGVGSVISLIIQLVRFCTALARRTARGDAR